MTHTTRLHVVANTFPHNSGVHTLTGIKEDQHRSEMQW